MASLLLPLTTLVLGVCVPGTPTCWPLPDNSGVPDSLGIIADKFATCTGPNLIGGSACGPRSQCAPWPSYIDPMGVTCSCQQGAGVSGGGSIADGSAISEAELAVGPYAMEYGLGVL